MGIYITCIPAVSVFLRHAISHATKLLSRFTSYSSKLLNTLPSSHSKDGDYSHRKTTNCVDGSYTNLGDQKRFPSSKESYNLELYSARSVKTNATTGSLGDHDDDRIHLRVDLQQGQYSHVGHIRVRSQFRSLKTMIVACTRAFNHRPRFVLIGLRAFSGVWGLSPMLLAVQVSCSKDKTIIGSATVTV